MSEVTALLRLASDEPAAARELFELIYQDLRGLAEARMRGERVDHTLQATALVHEAFVRLVGVEADHFNDRKHFFRVAAEAMRRILIDHARARLADKRGGGAQGFTLGAEDGMIECDPSRLIELDDAMRALAGEDERAAAIAELRYFGGVGLELIAETLGVSERTVKRDLRFARARLSELLGDR
ncbi:MAG: ECF-type sigma factor [Planctomycetota bacterium]